MESEDTTAIGCCSGSGTDTDVVIDESSVVIPYLFTLSDWTCGEETFPCTGDGLRAEFQVQHTQFRCRKCDRVHFVDN